jgi:replicative DNA helicase
VSTTKLPLRLADLDRDTTWEPFVPLQRPGVLPSFPVAALPQWGTAMVAAVAEATQTPPDLPGVAYLGTLAAAAGGRAEVEVQPHWREPLNIYAAPAMTPGSRKSAVFREMVAPLIDAERALQDKALEAIRERSIDQQIAQEAAQKAVRAAASASSTEADKAKAEALAAAQVVDSITVPGWPRLVADDATPEALTSLLASQAGRIAVLSAEGDLFDIMSGRYSQNGQPPNLGVFLKGHAGDMLLVDRKGREPERIDKPALTIVVTIQPQVLLDIARKPVLRGRGLLARVLYSLPPDLVGFRRIDVDPVPDEVAGAYHTNLAALALTLAEWTDPAVLMLTPAARTLLAGYQEEIEPRLRAVGGDLAEVRDWASKLAGAAVRIAGLLHLGGNLTTGYACPIEAETMTSAIELGRYFTAHAVSAFAQMGSDPLVDNALAVLAWIERTQPRRFTRREAHMSLSRAKFKKVTDLNPVLALLEDHGYLRREPPPDRAGIRGRPPSPAYLVHPNLRHGNHETSRTPGNAA